MEGHLAHEETRGRQKANSSFFLLPDRGGGGGKKWE